MSKDDLKRKTVNGFFWGILERILSQGQGIIYGIILARLLSPKEFGMIGMVTIFISIAQVFVDSGLNQALIRKQNCTNVDYSTVFWANIGIGFFFYIVIWLISPMIASFYGKPELVNLTRVVALAIIIGSLSLIQQTILTKEIDFKTLTKISTIGTLVAGIVSIVMAFSGWGVWSLVWRTIIDKTIRSFLLWLHNRWQPEKIFSVRDFKELFSFGSNILFISLIAAFAKNLYNLVIGKNYSATMLGYYTNADQYSGIPSTTLTSVTNSVSFPILASIQDDNTKLKASCSKLNNTIMFVSFFCMFGLAAIAKPLFFVLFGEKWLPAVVFFQILCLAYSISPMHTINQNIMKVKGKSDLFLRTEIIKYILFLPIVASGIIFGLNILIWGFAFFYWISFIINGMYTYKLINYSLFEQIKDFSPAFFLGSGSALFIWSMEFWLSIKPFFLLVAQSFVYIILIIVVSHIFKLSAFFELKQLLFRKLSYINIINNKSLS